MTLRSQAEALGGHRPGAEDLEERLELTQGACACRLTCRRLSQVQWLANRDPERPKGFTVAGEGPNGGWLGEAGAPWGFGGFENEASAELELDGLQDSVRSPSRVRCRLL